MKIEDIQNHAKQILKAINSAMKIKNHDLCFCGSGKKYKNCCDKNDGASIIFTEKAFENVLKYKKSQGGIVQQIPQGLFKIFSELSLNRFRCLYPNCNNPTISCHSIPKNILKEHFGSHCLESKLQDNSSKAIFTKTGIGEAGTLHVFCNNHDNNLFLPIDDLKIDITNKEQLFLLAFKSIAFSFRNIQYLMGIASQVEIFKPLLFSDNQKNTPQNTHAQLQIPKYTIEQYIRLKIANDVFNDAVKTLESNKHEDFSYFYRSFDYKKNIFFSSFINPLYDLNEKRINDQKTAINMAINIFTKDEKIHILLSSPPKSKKLYANLFKQLKKSDIQKFMGFLNNGINSAANKPLLPEDFDFKKNFIDNPEKESEDYNL